MKKITVILIAICFINITIINAQTNKWRVLMGVSSAISFSGQGPNILSIGYSTTKHTSNVTGFSQPDPYKSLSLNLFPRFGIFIFNNFAIGADICVGYNNQKDAVVNTDYDQTILAAGPFLRYYIPTQKVRPFIECNAVFGMLSNKYDNSGTNTDSESSINSYGAGIGLASRVGEKATFDFMVSYNSLTSKNKTNNPFNEQDVTSAFGIKFGFTFYLGSEI